MISAPKTHQNNKKAAPKSAAHPGTGSPQAIDRGQLLAAPQTLGSADLLKTQSELGNGVVQRVLDGVEYEPMTGSANQVSKATRAGQTVGYFKQDSPTAQSKDAILSSTVDQVLGTKALSKDTYETHSGRELGMDDPAMLDQQFGGAFSPVVPGSGAAHITFSTSPVTDKKKLRDAREARKVGESSNYKWVGDTPFAYKGHVQHRHDYLNPSIQRGLANIQTVDAIMGQQDRHSGNLAIDDSGSGQAMAFDNDYLLPANISENGENAEYDAYAGLRKDTKYDELQKPKKGLLELPARFNKKLAVWNANRNAKRTKAIKAVDAYFGNKSQGLPSHMDQATVTSLLGTKSSQFMEKLQAENPENWAKISQNPRLVETIRNRYSAVRRYAKAGAAAHKPGMLTPEQLSKYGTPEYQETVTKGTGGYLPQIVDHWDAQTYNEQMGALRKAPRPGYDTNLSARSYLARSVLEYNNAYDEESALWSGATYRAAGREHGKMPTKIDLANPIHAIPGAGITQTDEEVEAARMGGMYDAFAPEPVNAPQAIGAAGGALGPEPRKRRLVWPPPLPQLQGPIPPAPGPNPYQSGMDMTAKAIRDRFMGTNTLQPSAEPDHRRSEVVNQAGELPRQVSAAIQKQRGGGVGLPGPVQAEARQILGHDFSDVRIHAGAEANRLSRSIQARAFTIGKDIFFKQGLYTPGSTAGRETLLHELTHVAQQAGSNNNGPLRLGAPDTPHEKQAEHISKGSPTSAAPTTASQAGAVQRSYLDEKLSALGGKAKTLARKGKKWGLGKARSLGKEYLNHFFG